MKRSIFTITVILSLFSSLSTNANPSTLVYSSSVYSYSSDCNLDPTIYTPTQIRLNSAIYAQAAAVMSEEHFSMCYGDVDSVIFKSFKKNFDPLCILAFSIAEWGKYNDLKYSFTPAIATKSLSNSGVDMTTVDPLQINSQYYACLGIEFDDGKYMGPLQIDKSYLSYDNTSSYTCGYCPTDYYNWSDEVQWTFHDKCKYVKSAWNKDYEFKNQYAVIAHMSIAHNSGGAHLSLRDHNNNASWYPWKSSQAVFDYVDVITSGGNLQVILDDADRYADDLIEKYKSNNVSGGLYKSISSCRDLTYSMSINWGSVVKSSRVYQMEPDSSLSGDTLRSWEKTMYPIQSIWNYRVLERLYGL